MLFILVFIIAQITQTGTLETTLPVPIILDGFTLQSWNAHSMWNQTRTIIVQHLNSFCSKDEHCDADYGIENIHLLNVLPHGLSSIYLNISIDKPILTKATNTRTYNYTALLTGALFQTKIDIEHLHDNQLFNRKFSSSSIPSNQHSVFNRTTRLFFVLLGIALVALIFALTIFFFQKIHQHNYSRLLKTTRTSPQTQDELLSHSPST